MHADRWALQTTLGYVVVYLRKPTREASGLWSSTGLLHAWSPRDAAWLGLTHLPVDRACRVRFSTAAQSGRWWFVRESDRVWLYVQRWRGPVKAQPFCFKMLKAAGVPDLPVGIPLAMTFPDA